MFYLVYRRIALRIVAMLGAVAGMAACGYKGPLYLPPANVAPPPVQSQPALPPSSVNPVPPLPDPS